MGHGSVETNIGGGRRDLARVGHGKLELAAMAGALGAAALPHTTVAVKPVVVLSTSPYSND